MFDPTEIQQDHEPLDIWCPDRVLDEFRMSWTGTAGRREIEEYVADFDRFARRSLVRHLVACELQLRKQHGGSADRREYADRFPDAATEVDAAFSTHASSDRDLARTYSVDTHDSATTRGDPDAGPGPPGGPPGEIDRYQVGSLHATGGLGEVYLAEDKQLHRQVALKQLKTQFANSPDRRARFLREAEITGRLEHPGIVPLHGLGLFTDGRPYYAMRFIHGESMKQHIQQFHSSVTGRDRYRSRELRQLLTRFVDVCQAIQYAHSRGIVHRDLKPANIMLGEFGETLVVDWGLAKSVDDLSGDGDELRIVPESEATVGATEVGAVLGTPGYMSPEQASGDVSGVGPASDLYSLGATLFEILTGERHVSGTVTSVVEQIKSGTIRTVREVCPDAPAALEAVCRRAMELRPADRYASAVELAGDIESWLADEPVAAWPEPVSAQAARWVKRHLTLVTGTLAAVLATLVASGLALSVVARKNHELDLSNTQISRINRQLDNTNQLLTRTNVDLTEANRVAAANEARAEANYEKAQDVVEEFLTDVSQSEELLAGTPGTQRLRRTLLDRARRYYEDFVELNASQEARVDVAAANRTLGQILTQIGETQQGSVRVDQAIGVLRQLGASDSRARVELAFALNELGKIQLSTGQYTESEASFNESIQVFEQLGWDELSDTARQGFAQVYTNRGALYQYLSRTQEAENSYLLSMERWRQLLEEDHEHVDWRAELATVQSNYAYLLRTLGQLARAETMAIEAISGLDQLPDAESGKHADTLATALHNLGDAYADQGRLEEAETHQRRSLRIRQQLLERNPSVTGYRDGVAACHKSLGSIFSKTGKPAEAEQALLTAVRLREALVQVDPAVSEYQDRLAGSYIDLALHYRDTARMDLAESVYLQALEIRETIAAGEVSADDQNSLASTYHNLGEFYRLLERWLPSAGMFEKAVAIRESLVDRFPENVNYRSALASSCMQYGGPLLELDRHDEAEKAFLRAIDLLLPLLTGVHGTAEHRASLAIAYNNLAFFYSRIGKNADAEFPLIETQKLYEQLIAEDSTVAAYHSGMAACSNNLGAIYWFLERFDEAEQMLLRSARAHEALVAANPGSSSHRSDLANTYRNLSALFLNRGEASPEAVAYMAKSVEQLQRLAADEPGVAPYRLRLAAALSGLGLAHKRVGDFKAALDHYDEAYRVARPGGEPLDVEFEKEASLAAVRKAWIRATCPDPAFRDGAQAVKDATAACEASDFENPVHLDALAAALAETGDFDMAAQRQEEALRLASDANKSKYEARLELYRNRQPYRDE